MQYAKLIFLLLSLFPWLAGSALAAELIRLTQTSCQFVEAEGVDHHFVAHSPEECRSLNRTTAARLTGVMPLRLKSGDYVFRIYNRDVPYELGFWLRGAGLKRLTLPSVSGGGIVTGTFRDYAIRLDAGEYLYSCPLNPTPDYRLVVE